jgi:hypothetical protein
MVSFEQLILVFLRYFAIENLFTFFLCGFAQHYLFYIMFCMLFLLTICPWWFFHEFVTLTQVGWTIPCYLSSDSSSFYLGREEVFLNIKGHSKRFTLCLTYLHTTVFIISKRSFFPSLLVAMLPFMNILILVFFCINCVFYNLSLL